MVSTTVRRYLAFVLSLYSAVCFFLCVSVCVCLLLLLHHFHQLLLLGTTLLSFFSSFFLRKILYEIVSISKYASDPIAKLIPFDSHATDDDMEAGNAGVGKGHHHLLAHHHGRDEPVPIEQIEDLEKVPLSQLCLIEKNRGKAGVMNDFLIYYRMIAAKWFGEDGKFSFFLCCYVMTSV
jgi:hypothetical protein